MTNEIWKDIPGYEGLYQASNLGNVKSLNYRQTKKEKILKPFKRRDGYYQVNLCKNGIIKNIKIHQLVAMTFFNHIPCGMKLVVDHINDEKLDNRVENLQIVTGRYNVFKTQGRYSSKYKGVSWDKRAKKWRSRIIINGVYKHLGFFTSEEEAHQAYINKLKELENE